MNVLKFIALTIAVALPLTMLSYYADSEACRVKGEKAAAEFEYHLTSGCYLKTENGQWWPVP